MPITMGDLDDVEIVNNVVLNEPTARTYSGSTHRTTSPEIPDVEASRN